MRLKDPLKSKQLRQGLQELAEEGATQVFFPERNNDIILGAVGVLQFDVVASRLKEEYKVECEMCIRDRNGGHSRVALLRGTWAW